MLKERGLKIAVAESCTGGLISSRITDISGASDYFEAGITTYSNESKIRLLNVPEDIIDRYGAVSEETAKAMAEGVKKTVHADIGVSVTGIAGPTGGTEGKPVGTVFIGLATKKATYVRKFFFDGNRLEIRRKTSDAAFMLVEEYLEGEHI
ncbi:MAG TPA: CinA family protein [Syntrophorhabdaceae bacterium]|nr:CinA family protein [Syntrophorhabdaceae bacterium]MDI9561037.1 CinA family protein [Pseudomonadota bacterium]MBP8698889.1 CinA family protein [Syntrophorhabdaceae bacterium]HNQ62654.1 CinA family protein [Syntrophorhabdaceae bacterium]HPN97464.1 CinA family protein [Syntrophorhabdaceae bacterium]